MVFIDFPRNLKAIRRLKGMTQQQLATASGTSYAQIRDYEQGIHEPTFSILERIKTILQCTYDDLLK